MYVHATPHTHTHTHMSVPACSHAPLQNNQDQEPRTTLVRAKGDREETNTDLLFSGRHTDIGGEQAEVLKQ